MSSNKALVADSAPRQRRPDLRELLLEELQVTLEELGEPRFRALQIMNWIHARRVNSFSAMLNLPLSLRGKLAARFELVPAIPALLKRSLDGTRKLFIRLPDGEAVESVI